MSKAHSAQQQPGKYMQVALTIPPDLLNHEDPLDLRFVSILEGLHSSAKSTSFAERVTRTHSSRQTKDKRSSLSGEGFTLQLPK